MSNDFLALFGEWLQPEHGHDGLERWVCEIFEPILSASNVPGFDSIAGIASKHWNLTSVTVTGEAFQRFKTRVQQAVWSERRSHVQEALKRMADQIGALWQVALVITPATTVLSLEVEVVDQDAQKLKIVSDVNSSRTTFPSVPRDDSGKTVMTYHFTAPPPFRGNLL